jgi:hypothetical protein
VAIAGDRNILCAGDRASVLSDKIYCVRHPSYFARGRGIHANHSHVACATGRRLSRHSRRRLGAERMTDDNDPVRRMCAGIRRKGSVLPIAAIHDADFAAQFFRARFLNMLEGAMADIIPFPRRLNVFDPDLTTTMGDAYDKAMSTLDECGSELAIRELIAKRIIRMAQSGEADPELLYTSALSGFRKARAG